jgi:hypothetical protein
MGRVILLGLVFGAALFVASQVTESARQLHARVVEESTVGRDLTECREALNGAQDEQWACERALTVCMDGARYSSR